MSGLRYGLIVGLMMPGWSPLNSEREVVMADTFGWEVTGTQGAVVAGGALAISLRERAWQGVDARSWFFIILSGMFSGLLGQWTYYKALKYAEASRVVPIVGGYPLVAFALAVLLLGESITAQKLCGVMLVVGGIVLLR